MSTTWRWTDIDPNMRARHTSHPLPNFPVFSSSFLSSNTLVLGGGGGASRTGIKNKLVSSRCNDAALALTEAPEIIRCW